MGTPPAKIVPSAPASKIVKPVKTAALVASKKLNCFVMPDKPDKPGLVLISTVKIQDGCYVLGWQTQATTMLVSEAPQFYQFAQDIMEADIAFAGVFAFCLLVVLVITRVR